MRNWKVFPFSAIVGQDKMKLALVLNAINPKLGGVLIRGEKGTAKSTAVRGLAALLPEIEVVKGCKFGCDPSAPSKLCPECLTRLEKLEKLETETEKMAVVDLPINATEDRVVGTLDLEHALKEGEKKFEPGILAEANRGILYVDEVNLLDDHIVDVLLDSAAMGVNTVEREGVSYSHPAEFILVGTMNPEEGELRPQLLDRFGLCVNIATIREPDARVEIVKRYAEYEADPEKFGAKWKPEDEKLGASILAAQRLLPEVAISKEMLFRIANISIALAVDGHRSDLVLMKAAKTRAAFAGRKEVAEEDIDACIELVFAHRMRRRPFEDLVIDSKKIEELISRQASERAGSRY
jgi:magnesium chelatase ATPase subunit I